MVSAVRKVVPMGLAFILLALSAISAILLSIRSDEERQWVRHTLDIQNRLHQVEFLMTNAETGQRGYLLTGKPGFLGPYEQATTDLPRALAGLRRATQDNRRQTAALERLAPLLRERMALLGASVALVERGQPDAAVQVIALDRNIALMTRLRLAIRDMQAAEDRLLNERAVRVRATTRVMRAVLLASIILIVLFMLIYVPERMRHHHDTERTNHLLQAEIAERSAAQTQVRQLQKMEAVGQLTGGIAHDFNNMLAVIIGSLDMARRRLTGQEHPRLGQAIDHALDGAQRAATLTSRLLAFSRRQPLEPRVVDANKLVSGMSEMLRRTLGEAIRIETVLAGGLWQVNADPQQIENAVLNVAVNARDAMPQGGKLTIETANAELDDRYARAHDEVSAGQYVLISVTDNGVGMTRDIVDRAFEPFFTTKPVGQGTGLGLSQIFGFAKQSGGHIKIYSEPGAGTTIKIYLPRHHGAVAQTELAAPTADLPPGRAGEVILVVEDEPQVLAMSVDVLRDLGYTVVHAADGMEALAKLDACPAVSLLFTDVIMPGMTGRQLADEVRATRPDMRVLYTTGYTRNGIVHAGVVDQDVEFLAKPFTVYNLARKVRDVLDKDRHEIA